MAITIRAPAPAPNPVRSRHDRARDPDAMEEDADDEQATTALDRDLGNTLDADGDTDMGSTSGRSKPGRKRRKAIITPGELVTEDPQWMRRVIFSVSLRPRESSPY